MSKTKQPEKQRHESLMVSSSENKRTKVRDPRWTKEQINQAARITKSDVERALELIREASPELAEMVEAESATDERE